MTARRFWVSTWFERDRQTVTLYYGTPEETMESEEIMEWRDESVSEAVEDGFLDPRDWLGSAVDYCKDMKPKSFHYSRTVADIAKHGEEEEEDDE